ncbi:MAG TPA: putative metal-binding motif-containing protein, partial [Candidatus Limnocylindrales bacterium]|nr:putative metal-binding motif-containing protein [Candidatus Limnocylindrales bacterium]
CPVVDCNDTDATVNPAATEGPYGNYTCIDSRDNNCNGLTDAADTVACTPPPQESLATGEEPTQPGSVVSGDYHQTQASDNAYEEFQEGIFGNTSALVHIWHFDNVPAGTGHRLHIEGYRPNNTENDNFQLGYTLSIGGTFNSISNATINSATETSWDSGTFGASLSGTIYIVIRDTNSAANKKILDTVFIDQLTIKTP